MILSKVEVVSACQERDFNHLFTEAVPALKLSICLKLEVAECKKKHSYDYNDYFFADEVNKMHQIITDLIL